MKKIILLGFGAFSSMMFAQKNFIDQPYIETSAKVDSMVIPDRVYIGILLNEADSKNKISVEEQERKLEETLRRLGIDTKKDLALETLSSGYKKYFLRGQNVVKQKYYSLIVRDAVKAGKIVAGLEQQGISNINIEKVDYSKAEELLIELRAMAMKKSKKQAEKMVDAIGQKLGKAIHITENNNYYPRPMASSAKLFMEASSTNDIPDPIDTDFKPIKFEANVSVVYQLLD